MEMIDALTYGLGTELGKPIRQAFFQQKEQLLLLLKDEGGLSDGQKGAEERRLFITDMLALAVFHQRVIIPLHGAGNFYNGTKKLGVKYVTVGSTKLQRHHFLQAAKITRRFFAISQEFGIDVNKLNISSLADFIAYWGEAYRDR